MAKAMVKAGGIDAVEPPSAKAVARRPASRKAAPLIMALCLLLAILAVLFVPVLVGGAQTVSITSAAPAAMPVQVNEYATVEDAAAVLGYQPQLPLGSSPVAVRVLDGAVLELEYMVDRASVVYRTAPGNDDLTGDFTEYAYTVYETVDGVARSFAGPSEKKLNLAYWAAGGYSFAIVAPDGLEADSLRDIAQSVA